MIPKQLIPTRRVRVRERPAPPLQHVGLFDLSTVIDMDELGKVKTGLNPRDPQELFADVCGIRYSIALKDLLMAAVALHLRKKQLQAAWDKLCPGARTIKEAAARLAPKAKGARR